MKKATKKAAAKKTAKPRLKKATKLSAKDLEKVSGGTGRKGVNDDGI